jgi:hypothetical protein
LLEDRLGLYDEHGGDITGNETQEIEQPMQGVPVTDRECAAVAALQAANNARAPARSGMRSTGWAARKPGSMPITARC